MKKKKQCETFAFGQSAYQSDVHMKAFRYETQTAKSVILLRKKQGAGSAAPSGKPASSARRLGEGLSIVLS